MFREIVFSRSSQNGLSPDPWATFGEHTSWEAAYAVQLKQAIDLARKEPHVAAYAEVARLFDLKQANITDAGRLLAKVLAEYDENGAGPAQRGSDGAEPGQQSGGVIMRSRLYPSDTTDAEWLLLEPLLPVPACRTRRGGRPEKHPRRDIVDAIRYITDNGAKWRALPVDFPPYQTVFGFFSRWTRAGVFNQIRDQLRRAVRLRAGRCPNPDCRKIHFLVDERAAQLD